MKLTVGILFLSAVFDVGICCLRKLFAEKSLKTASDNILYSIIITMAALPLLLLSGGYKKPGNGVVLLSLCFGFLIALEQFAANEAFRLGPFSLSSLMAQAGMLITVLDACLRWGEQMTLKNIVGIVLMLIAMAFMMNAGNEKKATFKWFAAAVLWMCVCGLSGVMQKTYTVRFADTDMYVFLFWSFLFSVVFLGIFLLIGTKRMGTPVTLILNRKPVMSAIVTGFLYMGLHIYALIGVGTLSAGYFFPVCNGLKLAAEVLAGAILFREKLTGKQMAGLALGFAAILLLSFS